MDHGHPQILCALPHEATVANLCWRDHVNEVLIYQGITLGCSPAAPIHLLQILSTCRLHVPPYLPKYLRQRCPKNALNIPVQIVGSYLDSIWRQLGTAWHRTLLQLCEEAIDLSENFGAPRGYSERWLPVHWC
jgi:hypothetical protein